jgi:hypothetical protein
LHLSVFRDHYEVHTEDELRMHLAFRHDGKYGAFWITPTKNGFPSMALFINDDEACMFYIREDGDPGFHSSGVDSKNFKDEMDFVIDNFQLDRYPRAMVVPASQGVYAFEEFFRTGSQPRGVRWFEV